MRHCTGTESSPPSSCKLPLSMANRDDLPAPLRPTSPIFSLGLRVTDVLSSNTLLPRRKVTFLKMIIGGVEITAQKGLQCSTRAASFIRTSGGESSHRVSSDTGKNPREHAWPQRSEEHTSELQSLMRISYAVF